jgi:hypothetical protein
MKGCLGFFYFHILYRQIWLNFPMMMTSWAIYHKIGKEKEKRKHCREDETLHMRSWILRSFVNVLLLICQVSNSTLKISNFQDVYYTLNYDIIKGNKHMIDVQCNRKGPFWNE